MVKSYQPMIWIPTSSREITFITSPSTVSREPAATDSNSFYSITGALFMAFTSLMVLFFLAFTELGMGASFYKALSRDTILGNVASSVGVAVLVIVYVIDMRGWSQPYRPIKMIVLFLLILCACGVAGSMFRQYPYAPLIAYFITSFLACAALYQLFAPGTDESAKGGTPKSILNVFILYVGYACMMTGICALIACLIWSGINGFWWGADTKVEFRNRLRVCTDTVFCSPYGSGMSCSDGCEEIPDISACDPAAEHCLAAMLLFSGGYIMSIFNIMVGSSLVLAMGTPKPATTKTFASVVFILLSFIWIAASLNGASTNIANVVIGFSITGIIILLVSKICLMAQLEQQNIRTTLIGQLDNDWGRAAACLLVLPLFPVIAMLSVLNQWVLQFQSSEKEDTWLTPEIQSMLTKILDWKWTSVLKKAIGLSFGYIGVVVGVGKITTLFLAWLNVRLMESGMDVWGISAVVFAVGITLQFIPVVPGIPIYLACGAIIVPAGENTFGSFYSACAWASFVAITCKLCGVTLVQVTMGALGRNSTSIKSMVAINSEPIRAFKLITQGSYFSKKLTLILIGGPDWPVAVMAGILNQSIIRMVIGTLPVFIPVATTVIAGGYLSTQGDASQALASVFSAISAVAFSLMTAAFVGVLRDIDQTALEEIPIDKEVEEYDAKKTEKIKKRDAEVEWIRITYLARSVLVLSVLTAWAGVMIAVFAADNCFNDVTLASDYREAPIYSNFGNLIKYPIGTSSAILLTLSMGMYACFYIGCWIAPSLFIIKTDP